MKEMMYLAVALALGTNVHAAASSDRLAALDWTRQHAVAADDAALMHSLMASPRVIALGEASHGTQDYLLLRNRLIRISVERFGVTAIAVETGFAESGAINDYVHGKRELEPALARDMFTFGAPDALRANLELLEWLRAHNGRADVTRKVSFYGIEMLGRNHRGAQRHARPAFDAAIAYAMERDSARVQALKVRLEPLLQKLTETGYSTFTAQERDGLTLATADLVSLFERRRVEWVAQTSRNAFERALRNARNARHLDADLRAGGWWIEQGEDPNQRDAASAEVVRWILDQEGRDGLVFLFAHNFHVRKCPQLEGTKRFSSVVQNLQLMSADRVVVIGSASAPSSEQASDSVSSLLEDVGRSSYALDLRQLQAEAAARVWWTQPREWTPDGGGRIFKPAECFDALIYTGRPARAEKLTVPQP